MRSRRLWPFFRFVFARSVALSFWSLCFRLMLYEEFVDAALIQPSWEADLGGGD